MKKRAKKKHKFAFVACSKCILNYEKLYAKAQLETLDPDWEQYAFMYLSRKLECCPFNKKPPFNKIIRKKYGIVCFSCQEEIGCPANLKRSYRGVECLGCYDMNQSDDEQSEQEAIQYDAECEKHGMDYPEWQIEQQQIRMERHDIWQMEQAKKLKQDIIQIKIPASEENINEALDNIIENLNKSE